MKYKTSKLKKLERERYSILTNDLEHCFICKRMASDMHEIYSAGNRRISMQNGYCVPLCRTCHQEITINNTMNLQLKQLCQMEVEKQMTREEFIKTIGKNYL